MPLLQGALESFAPVLESSLVKRFTDSQTATKILEVRSIKLDLHRLAVKIFQYSVGVAVDPTN